MTKTELLQVAKPIIFRTEMVQAILEGRKTVTRRVIKLPRYIRDYGENGYTLLEDDGGYSEGWSLQELIANGYIKKRYKVGDIVYVKETWQVICQNDNPKYYYRANGEYSLWDEVLGAGEGKTFGIKTKWQPSSRMPKEAARTFLMITDARIERLQDITWKQAIKEGIELEDATKQEEVHCNYCSAHRGVRCYGDGPVFCQDSGECEKAKQRYEDDCIDYFTELWNSTIEKQDLDKYGWAANPPVEVYEFERINVEVQNNET